MSVSYSSAALELGNVADVQYLDELIVTNTDGSALFLQLFPGETSVPADTTVPEVVIAVPAGSTVSYDPQGTRWSVGGSLAFCLSSTAATKTAAGAVGFFTVRGS